MHAHTYDDSGSKGHDCNDPYDENMFSHIAVALSGGGIRATGFHLGMLDILDRLELLQNVHILSSFSGGRMVGTTYALCAQEWDPGSPQGESPLQHCFNNLYDFLNHLNTMEEIFQNLTKHGECSPSGRRDLITGMANMLDERFFANAKYYKPESRYFGTFWNENETSNHLKEVVFNAAEYKTGLDILVSAGQATTCYNLMLHLKQRYGDPETGELPADSVAASYYDKVLENFWKPLVADPFCLVKKLKQGLDPAHVATCTRGCGIPNDIHKTVEAG